VDWVDNLVCLVSFLLGMSSWFRFTRAIS
jgi:hypothetical protein